MTRPLQPFDNVLGASLRALQDLVAPSLDRGNPLAQEQLVLVCRFLAFVAQRAPLAHARQRQELALACATAQAVLEAAPSAPAVLRDALLAACEEAGLPDTAAMPDRLAQVLGRLLAATSALVRCAQRFDAAERARVEFVVLRASAASVQLQRAWFAPLGLDSGASSLPALEDLLAQSRPA